VSVFISHADAREDAYDNIVFGLESKKVPYWNPLEIMPGGSLRDQIRDAVERCPVCIFVATQEALGSSWCGAELGAFWGAGKPIIVYLADSSLKPEQLPPVVQGDVWERKIARVVSRAKQLVSETETPPTKNRGPGSLKIGDLTMDELERVIAGSVSVAIATSTAKGKEVDPAGIGRAAKGSASRVLAGIKSIERLGDAKDDRWRYRMLWVDDRPNNNIYERKTFESMGFYVELSLSTQEALEALAKRRFAAVISDMARKEGSDEGYVLLEKLRQKDEGTPFFIYSSSNALKHKREAQKRGAQGYTNRPDDLVQLVLQHLREKDAD
jgi:CheY-like chemotaxis protein